MYEVNIRHWFQTELPQAKHNYGMTKQTGMDNNTAMRNGARAVTGQTPGAREADSNLATRLVSVQLKQVKVIAKSQNQSIGGTVLKVWDKRLCVYSYILSYYFVSTEV